MKKMFLFLVLGIVLVGTLFFVSSAGEITFCCEKTTYGAWCMNEPEEKCSSETNPATEEEFRKVPTSCEATGYCKLGCCYNSKEGTCMPNTPQIVCQEEEGIWEADAECDIPQCDLGCCLMIDQAAFVTKTRCKRLSALYGLETNFRTGYSNEFECIASAGSDDKGACVFEEEFETTCRVLTRGECQEIEDTMPGAGVSFHEGFLCSAETLGTNCGPGCVENALGQIVCQTTCVEGKEEVYFVDSCGNVANIYDASKVKNNNYWTYIESEGESCTLNKVADAKTCGNCDYFSTNGVGTTCAAYERGRDTKPEYGDYVCRDLGCKDKDFSSSRGRDPEHGETWCVTNTLEGNVPGAEYFRKVCYNGEVTVEPCAPFRQEICIESEVNGFSTAACSANVWHDCLAQDNEEDCENLDHRDCEWTYTGEGDEEDTENKKTQNYVCVPDYAPGFDFWDSEGQADEICGQATHECVVKFERGLIDDDWDCVENCHCCVNGKYHKGCKGDQYAEYRMAVCEALGDCGTKVNYIGVEGEKEIEDFITINVTG